ncbi:MAG: DNA gyrase subunit A, partial [Thermoleophilia bacterium]|nr:DNA gyrase subunit A [Thermoleophilia bacterium]
EEAAEAVPEPVPTPEEAEEAAAEEVALSPERVAEMEAAEELILAVTDGGFGKRTLAYDYRITGRGGQGLEGITLSARTGREVVATFAVRPGDDVMLVTDTGRLIRLPADQVRLTRRRSLGVMLVRLDEGERVTSCFPVVDDQGDAAAAEADGAGPPSAATPDGVAGDA